MAATSLVPPVNLDSPAGASTSNSSATNSARAPKLLVALLPLQSFVQLLGERNSPQNLCKRRRPLCPSVCVCPCVRVSVWILANQCIPRCHADPLYRIG